MTILTALDYPQIRAVLDVSLTSTQLPDDTIGMDIFVGRAEADVLALDPDAETRTGADLQHIKNAAIYFTAALLCPTVVRITSMTAQTRDLAYTRQAFDPEERAAELRALAVAEVTAVLTPDDTTPNRPTVFARATANRGKMI